MSGCSACGDESLPGARFCASCGAALATTATRRKTVTILFCDVVGSTELGTALDPEIMRTLLTEYWGVGKAAILRHGGIVEKFIGDAVVGVFGIPTVREDDAARACRAALELVAALDEVNASLPIAQGVRLAVRIGINTGEVMAGDLAEATTFMTGDAANVAARLEQVANPGEILIGETTVRLVASDATIERLPPVTVKGKAAPVEAARLLQIASIDAGARRRFSSEIVGRRRQLALATAAFDAAIGEPTCMLLTILGTAGVGKSRLVDELLSRIASTATVLEGRCLAYGEGITYWPVAEMLRRLTDGDKQRLRSLLDGAERADLINEGLAGLLSADLTATDELPWSFRRFIEHLARDRPVVVVFDDLQWAEPRMLDLVEHITSMSRDHPVLVACMARPELLDVRPTWATGARNAVTMLLEPLSTDECSELVLNLLGSGLPEADVARISEAGGGNPLFVEETIGMLKDEGVLTASGSGWEIATSGLSRRSIPLTVQAVLAARIDGLTPSERMLLEHAAVMGQVFYPQESADESLDAHGVETTLQGLVGKDLVRQEPSDLSGFDAYGFRHLLIRDATYDAIPKARRAQLHERVARWMERETSGAGVQELVAYHLEQAYRYGQEFGAAVPELAEGAAGRLLHAGRRAHASEDVHAAVKLLVRAADLVDPTSVLGLDVRVELGIALYDAGDAEAADQTLEEAGSVAERAHDEAHLWHARLHRARLRYYNDSEDHVEELRTLVSASLAAFTRLGDTPGIAWSYIVRSDISVHFGQSHDAMESAEQALEGAWGSGDELLVRDAISRAINGLDGGPDPPRVALRWLDDHTARILEGQPHLAGMLDRTRAKFETYAGALEVGRAGTQAWLDLQRELRSPFGEATAWFQLGNIEELCDLLEPAAAAYERAAQILEETGVGESSRSSMIAYLGRIRALQGRDHDAIVALDQARTLSSPSDLVNRIVNAGTEGLVLARRGDREGAEAALQTALELAGQTDWLWERGDTLLALAQAREWSNDLAGALAAAREALELFERKELAPRIATTASLLSRLELASSSS